MARASLLFALHAKYQPRDFRNPDEGRSDPIDPIVGRITAKGITLDGTPAADDWRTPLGKILDTVTLVVSRPPFFISPTADAPLAKVKEVLEFGVENKLDWVRFGTGDRTDDEKSITPENPIPISPEMRKNFLPGNGG